MWRLYDTYGFPVDLTRLMADELSLTVDEKEFEEAQAQSKEASKAQKKGAKDVVKLDVHDIAALEKNPDVPKTDDSAKFGEFGRSVNHLQKCIHRLQHGEASTRRLSPCITTNRS